MDENLRPPPAFLLYAQDALAGTIGMTNEEFGVYFRLLFISWISDPPCTLPADEDALRRLVGMSKRKFDRVWCTISSKFEQNPPPEVDRIFSRRLQKEYAAQMVRRSQNTENGRLGGRPKITIENRTVSERLANGNPTVTETKPFQSSSSSSSSIKDPPSPPGGRPRKVKSVKAGCPSEFPITDEMKAWAAENVPSVQIVSETGHFLDRNRARSEMYVDWTAAWRCWMRNAVKFAGKNGIGPQLPLAGQPIKTVRGDPYYVPKSQR